MSDLATCDECGCYVNAFVNDDCWKCGGDLTRVDAKP